MTMPQTVTKTQHPKPRVLVVEDQLLIAGMIESELRELGFEVVGPAFTIDAAENLVQRNHFCAAVLILCRGAELSAGPCHNRRPGQEVETARLPGAVRFGVIVAGTEFQRGHVS